MKHKSSKKPFLYEKLYDMIREKIEKGELAEGSLLPNVQEFSALYKVSAITVTKALDTLKEDGYLRRVKGRGSFVCLPKQPADLQALPVLAKDENEAVHRLKLLGLILEHASSCYGLDLLYHIDSLAQQAGYKLCVRFSYGDSKRETEEILFLKSLDIEGLILMPCHGLYYNMTILKLVMEDFPIVLIDKYMEGIPVSSVRTDNRQAMSDLVTHLINTGKQKIGFITMEEDGTSSIKDRLIGFCDSIQEAGIEKMPECYLKPPAKMDIYSESFHHNHVAQITEYLSSGNKPDAVVCAEYGIARYVIPAKEAAGISDLTICCMDEDYHAPDGLHFTHIRQDEGKIAQKAFSLLLEQLLASHRKKIDNYLIPGILRIK